jgi:hypothetical protein
MADESDKPASETPQSAPAALPIVDAPSISPAEAAQPASVIEPPTPITADPPKTTAVSFITPKLMMLAASVVLSAGLGGLFGAVATGAMPKDTSVGHERQAMQQSLARLTNDIAALKAELAAAEKTGKAQTARVAELDAKLRERLARNQATVTGSIAMPATVPALSVPAAVPAAPTPAPAAAIAAAEPAPLPPPRPLIREANARDGVADGWTVLGARRGFVYVQSGHDIYRVAPGARLPGLGIVEEVRRDDGQWVVVTRRGIIVATRDRF